MTNNLEKSVKNTFPKRPCIGDRDYLLDGTLKPEKECSAINYILKMKERFPKSKKAIREIENFMESLDYSARNSVMRGVAIEVMWRVYGDE